MKSVSESSTDGGNNVVTFSDGKTVTIKNGTKGSTGSQGPKGDTGAPGASGVYVLNDGESMSNVPSTANVVIDPSSEEVSGIYTQIAQLQEEKANKSGLTLGVHTDGLVYIFIDGAPHGNGLNIKADVVEGDVFGYVDENNVIVLNGALAEGTYTIKYEMDNGDTVEIGDLVLDTNVYYTVTNTLTQCTTNNSATKAVQGGSYSATITAKSGYELSSVKVTMGGTNISSTAVSGGKITIANVTGNIVITAVATEVQAAEPTNFAEPNTTNKTDWSIWCNDARFGSDGAYRSLAGNVVTNYIPIKVGDTLRFTGLSVATTGTSMNNGLAYYTEDKVIIAPSYWYWFADDNNTIGDLADTNVTDGVYTITLTDDFGKYVNDAGKKGTETAYVRISGTLTGSVDDVAINVKRNGTWL